MAEKNGAFNAANWLKLAEGQKVFKRDGQEFGIKFKAVTPFALVNAIGEIPNPLLAAFRDISGEIQTGSSNEAAAMALLKNVDKFFGKLGVLDDALSKVMAEIVIEPQLVEQGYENGVPVHAIPADWQIEVVIEAVGGMEGIMNLFRFLGFAQEQNAGMAASPTVL